MTNPDHSVPEAHPRVALTPAAKRLLRVLTRLSDTERSTYTNRDLARQIGTSTTHPRTVNSALRQLQDAELISIRRRSPHPGQDAVARTINLSQPVESQRPNGPYMAPDSNGESDDNSET